jgi:undecaprenyl-diphosphatase
LDQTVFHLINQRWTTPFLDLFMAAMSDVDIWRPLLVLAALALVVWGGFRGRAFILCLLICLLISDQVTNLLKNAIGRHRPKQVEAVRMVQLAKARPEFLTLLQKPTIRISDETDRNRSGPSFPSGHTTNNTVIAVCCTLFYRRRGALYWIVTAAVGWSRVYLGAHWPTDVMGTVLLAIGETLLILAGLELLWQTIGNRLAPSIHRAHPKLLGDFGP